METVEIKTPQERTDSDLLELVCQLHSRAINQPHNKQMHDYYMEARAEMDRRLHYIDEIKTMLENEYKEVERKNNEMDGLVEKYKLKVSASTDNTSLLNQIEALKKENERARGLLERAKDNCLYDLQKEIYSFLNEQKP